MTKNKRFYFLAVACVLVGGFLMVSPARADDSSDDSASPTSSFQLNQSEKEKIHQKVDKEMAQDLDKDVTDIQMRAGSGAKSKWSSSYFFHYYGPAINDLTSGNRPLIGGQRNPQPTDLDGNVGLRYRFDKNNSLFMAIGVYKSDPLHTNEAQQPVTFNNPMVDYNYTNKIFDGIQFGSDTEYIQSTVPYQTSINQIGQFASYLTIVKQLGHSRYDVGAWVNTWYDVFGNQKVSDKVASEQNDVGFQAFPTLDYRPSDDLKLWTSFTVINQMHYAVNPGFFQFAPAADYQYLGVGFAPTRDLYFDPYVAFEPAQVSFNRMIFNLTTDINF